MATGAAHPHARAIADCGLRTADCGLESEGGLPPSNGTSLRGWAVFTTLGSACIAGSWPGRKPAPGAAADHKYTRGVRRRGGRRTHS